ncbi:unnamed protein product (macronuclear) [Paramecium tetraurelia]|uniref:Uncharacterized protein n=1 Tax=Paramecium tetraurelia TaxID=5888 RepID=A0DU17_PARTE|nr:uncharacterized protein GSPATT00020218001 [Paramecium tetraurelia]CAK86534.1 unnamed protein product [Paramecium tetraurelia]|eukprot:XP_001453931.1 hypothetical protein (macronuclear) [Paramecium tetraurelia strain d4-2]
MQCIEDLQSDSHKTTEFNKAMIIEEGRQKLLESLEYLIKINTQKVESLQIEIISLKSSLIQKLDQILDITKDWISNQQKQNIAQSFLKEIDLIIKNQQFQDDHIILGNSIIFLNKGWIHKITKNLELFKTFSEYQNCNQILSNLGGLQSQQSTFQLEFIDDSIQQKEACRAIVFDPKGKKMVSTSGKEIKIWNFENGKIKLVQSLQEHEELVNCLVFSQKQDYFISGSSDKSIRLWKQSNNKWQSSKKYNDHKGMIQCLILTQKEDQLISCCKEKLIKIWIVDFSSDQLKPQYSLEKHNGIVYSLSLNESESVLVSCGSDSIIMWDKGKNNKWKFFQVFKQTQQEIGCHVKFLKEDQFIWLPERSNHLCVFEQYKDGEFQENQKKRVCFSKTSGYLNEFNFPIIYNKDQNLIFLRHKMHICILKVQNDGYLSIVQEFDCKHWCIYGTITNNGQYLTFWGGGKNNYETYKIQRQ